MKQKASKHPHCHAEFISAFPFSQEIAGLTRNDGSIINGSFKKLRMFLRSFIYTFLCILMSGYIYAQNTQTLEQQRKSRFGRN